LDIFTVLGREGLGRSVMNSVPMLPRNSSSLLGVFPGNNAPAMTTN
jgi:hypothetical protein